MNEEMRGKLINLLDEVDASPATRQSFLDNPISVLNSRLALGLDDHIAKTPIANQLLIAALKNDSAVEQLQKTTAQYQAGTIDLTTARSEVAKTLVDSEVIGSDDWLKRLRESLRPPIDPALLNPDLPPPEMFDPQAIAIPNIAAAVDIVVVVTEAAVVNSEVIFSGRGRNDATDVRRIARTLGRGQ